jgi:hypothetical protein
LVDAERVVDLAIFNKMIQHCRGKDRAPPHIGRDAVKFGSTDDAAYFRRAGVTALAR